MIDGVKILESIDTEMKNYHIPKYQIYFYKPNNYEPEKVDSYSLENLGQMNQLKIDITHIISDYSTYNQYKNYRIELFYVNYKEELNHIATLRDEEIEEFEEDKFRQESCIG
tara:strand:+ start:389 stop:724 length:336 start_codon:yes stop_codon:yes gene_type:complete